ncbi:hypothetical protein [Bradyrhizobium elkanii]|uniref:hypothetical protein n=2 Tax=Bradyrhizobium TaxID=374 RepID=UPI000421341E|nr:hypothetical protein [Bradyrhizobium elkanii]
METRLNQAIWSLPTPDRIKRLPVSATGYYVPWFVAWIDREPDFRVIGPGKLAQAVNRKLCWICGQPLGVYKAFPIGPMCAINRNISEPPSHWECAEYAVQACPFLANPRMRRNEKDLPSDHREPAGTMIRRNPGAIGIWVTKQYSAVRCGDGVLFRLGDPERVVWYRERRKATRAEVEESIETGLPELLKRGEISVDELAGLRRKAEQYLPA